MTLHLRDDDCQGSYLIPLPNVTIIRLHARLQLVRFPERVGELDFITTDAFVDDNIDRNATNPAKCNIKTDAIDELCQIKTSMTIL